MGIQVLLTPGKIRWRLPIMGLDDPYLRHFTIYLDSGANYALGLVCRLGPGSPDIPVVLNPEEAANHLRRTGREANHSFPSVASKITLMEAFNVVRIHGPGYPLLAREIDCFYLMHSEWYEPPYPAWVINMRGLPPDDPGGPLPSSQSIVDAISGKWKAGSMRYSGK